ncbi:sirohydrochlorin chelatase [Spirulina subsalsa FACHB-351]|uniref:Sirohydrochlorin chelatase n=1 Tax=Spirulina subsalsa FACHB-351 TaxID=234711 RepID=A0ABT3LBM7_9CYAN|nr:sirohydrochlorin chelatase [Spirulina subsalsa]MCW6038380.1 sirohydrochlorin chelatase [Spirulina subsalsa FACHB-351]
MFSPTPYSPSAYLLVFHGSRDPRPQQGCEQLAEYFRLALQEAVPQQPPLVATAALEFAPLPLSQQILTVAQLAQKQSIPRLKIIPLFLLAGVHVGEDIPAEIEQAKQQLDPDFQIQQVPHLGDQKALLPLLQQAFASFPSGGRILLSHGSRRPLANQPIAELAQSLQAQVAYWSVAPHLGETVAQLAGQNLPSLTILPYFLFSGGITDAIAQQIHQLQAQYPHLPLQLGHPLGPSPALAQVILNQGLGLF